MLATALLSVAVGAALMWILAHRAFGAFTQLNLHSDVIAYESLIEHIDHGNVDVVRNWLLHSLCGRRELLRQNQEAWLIPDDEPISRTLKNGERFDAECFERLHAAGTDTNGP